MIIIILAKVHSAIGNTNYFATKDSDLTVETLKKYQIFLEFFSVHMLIRHIFLKQDA